MELPPPSPPVRDPSSLLGGGRPEDGFAPPSFDHRDDDSDDDDFGDDAGDGFLDDDDDDHDADGSAQGGAAAAAGVPIGGARKRQGKRKPRRQAPLSRSLRDNSWQMAAMSSSMPHNFTMADLGGGGGAGAGFGLGAGGAGGGAPAGGLGAAIEEQKRADGGDGRFGAKGAGAAAGGGGAGAGGGAGGADPSSMSFNEGSTIYSMLRESSSVQATPVGTPVAPLEAGLSRVALGSSSSGRVPAAAAARGGPGDEDDGGLQFSISLDPNESSSFLETPEEAPAPASTQFFSGIN